MLENKLTTGADGLAIAGVLLYCKAEHSNPEISK
jgi:hypothetical protein